MVDLNSISIRNFISWGDYETKITLANRGQCFIAGEIEDTESADRGSNGAGKSSITQAILWCLSGKTMYKKNPGNGVLNMFTDKDCIVSLKLANGSEVTRVRRRDGNTELLYSKGGKSIIDCTLSTTSNQQKQLERELGFDYDIFCGSVFFNQFSHPWMEMGDQTRKQTMERIMGIDRLSIYAELAKKKRDRIEIEQSKLKAQADGVQLVVTSFSDQITATKRLSEKFNTDQATRIQDKLDLAEQYRAKVDKFEVINIIKLTQRWAIVEKVKAKIKAMKEESRTTNRKIDDLETQHSEQVKKLHTRANEIESQWILQIDKVNDIHNNACKTVNDKDNSTIKSLQQQRLAAKGTIIGSKSALEGINESIELWRSKEGQVCSECEQEVPPTHTASKIEPKLDKKAQLDKQILDSESEYLRLGEEIDKIEEDNSNRLSDLEQARKNTIKELQEKHDDAVKKFQDESSTDKLQHQIDKLKSDKCKLDDTIDAAEEKLSGAEPAMTVKEAEATNAQKDLLLKQIDRDLREAKEIEKESNPHLDTMADLENRIMAKQDELDRVNNNVSRYDLVYAHWHYVYRAYSERRKIKSFMIGRHQPYFNSRFNHYLDSFGLDVKIQLTDSLGLDSNLWGYDFQSGGERARTNLAFLFAVFDLHSGIHGRQCNLLVLDEPDHHLDGVGRRMLIDIINDDLATRFDTIFVISHNNAFKDVFPSQLTVRRVDRLSYLDETR